LDDRKTALQDMLIFLSNRGKDVEAIVATLHNIKRAALEAAARLDAFLRTATPPTTSATLATFKAKSTQPLKRRRSA
jgi:hypothetical protein